MPPKVKSALCGDNPFGNIFYPFWRDLDCVCCAFYRGMAVVLTANVIALVLGAIF